MGSHSVYCLSSLSIPLRRLRVAAVPRAVRGPSCGGVHDLSASHLLEDIWVISRFLLLQKCFCKHSCPGICVNINFLSLG